jgi:hypothetical protein
MEIAKKVVLGLLVITAIAQMYFHGSALLKGDKWSILLSAYLIRVAAVFVIAYLIFFLFKRNFGLDVVCLAIACGELAYFILLATTTP